MHVYFIILGHHIPSYGVMITTGMILVNILAVTYILKTHKLDINDFIILEAYCILGGFAGAKILYLLVSYKDIEWDKILDIMYFSQLMQGGFVFYGGLIGGIAFALWGGAIHRIQTMEYIRTFVCFVPFVHSFGRIGCFLSGCCYGIPYSGIGAVIFPDGSYAPTQIELFPVQLMEAILLMCIFGVVVYFVVKRGTTYSVEIYLILYGFTRFALEYLRYDDARGVFCGISTSQWISMAIVIVACVSVLKKLAYGKITR